MGAVALDVVDVVQEIAGRKATQNNAKAVRALATAPGSVNSRANTSGARTKAFLIHSSGARA
jgi:hypothetical protein